METSIKLTVRLESECTGLLAFACKEEVVELHTVDLDLLDQDPVTAGIMATWDISEHQAP